MSTNAYQEFSNADTTTDDIPQGGDTIDNSYASHPGQTSVPVVNDEAPIEQPKDAMNPDSDEMLSMPDIVFPNVSPYADSGES